MLRPARFVHPPEEHVEQVDEGLPFEGELLAVVLVIAADIIDHIYDFVRLGLPPIPVAEPLARQKLEVV